MSITCTWTGPLGEDSQPLQIVNLGSLAENMVYRLPGCSDLMIRKTLQNVYREFCKISTGLRMRADFTRLEGVRDYTLNPIFASVIDTVTDVSLSTGTRLVANVDYVLVAGGSFISVRLAEGLVTDLAGTGETVPTLQVECVLVPLLNCEEAPAWFLSRYADAIISGALYRLFAMGNKPWSDGSQAAQEQVSYNNALNEVRLSFYSGDRSGFSSGELDVRPTGMLI